MTTHNHDLQAIAPVLATFDVQQVDGIDSLKDVNLGDPVSLTGDLEVGPVWDGSLVLGKLIALTLNDCDDGDRAATLQIGGVCKFRCEPLTQLEGTVVGSAVPGLVSSGGNGRGLIIRVKDGTCTVLLD